MSDQIIPQSSTPTPQPENFTAQPKRQLRGFAAMDPAKQREIARMGGKSVAPELRAFARNHELAHVAGRKGGQVSGARARARRLQH